MIGVVMNRKRMCSIKSMMGCFGRAISSNRQMRSTGFSFVEVVAACVIGWTGAHAQASSHADFGEVYAQIRSADDSLLHVQRDAGSPTSRHLEEAGRLLDRASREIRTAELASVLRQNINPQGKERAKPAR
ncbi:hypothetical protein WR30_30560 [Burkholderia contaminans FFH2055]|nr:hypothetical protein WR30_30560 [Burkholderia contaminans FFH2055]